MNKSIIFDARQFKKFLDYQVKNIIIKQLDSKKALMYIYTAKGNHKVDFNCLINYYEWNVHSSVIPAISLSKFKTIEMGDKIKVELINFKENKDCVLYSWNYFNLQEEIIKGSYDNRKDILEKLLLHFDYLKNNNYAKDYLDYNININQDKITTSNNTLMLENNIQKAELNNYYLEPRLVAFIKKYISDGSLFIQDNNIIISDNDCITLRIKSNVDYIDKDSIQQRIYSNSEMLDPVVIDFKDLLDNCDKTRDNLLIQLIVKDNQLYGRLYNKEYLLANNFDNKAINNNYISLSSLKWFKGKKDVAMVIGLSKYNAFAKFSCTNTSITVMLES